MESTSSPSWIKNYTANVAYILRCVCALSLSNIWTLVHIKQVLVYKVDRITTKHIRTINDSNNKMSSCREIKFLGAFSPTLAHDYSQVGITKSFLIY